MLHLEAPTFVLVLSRVQAAFSAYLFLTTVGIITAGTERWHQCRLLTSQVLERALQAVGICQTDGVRF